MSIPDKNENSYGFGTLKTLKLYKPNRKSKERKHFLVLVHHMAQPRVSVDKFKAIILSCPFNPILNLIKNSWIIGVIQYEIVTGIVSFFILSPD
jgi:hypothetical protein